MAEAPERNCRIPGLFGEIQLTDSLNASSKAEWRTNRPSALSSMVFLKSWKGRREIQLLENGTIQP